MPSSLLESVDPEILAGFEVRDIVVPVVTEYLARAPSGELLVVVRPDNGQLDAGSFRLFYGPVDALVEQHVLTVARQRDGGSTEIALARCGRRRREPRVAAARRAPRRELLVPAITAARGRLFSAAG